MCYALLILGGLYFTVWFFKSESLFEIKSSPLFNYIFLLHCWAISNSKLKKLMVHNLQYWPQTQLVRCIEKVSNKENKKYWTIVYQNIHFSMKLILKGFSKEVILEGELQFWLFHTRSLKKFRLWRQDLNTCLPDTYLANWVMKPWIKTGALTKRIIIVLIE